MTPERIDELCPRPSGVDRAKERKQARKLAKAAIPGSMTLRELKCVLQLKETDRKRDAKRSRRRDRDVKTLEGNITGSAAKDRVVAEQVKSLQRQVAD